MAYSIIFKTVDWPLGSKTNPENEHTILKKKVATQLMFTLTKQNKFTNLPRNKSKLIIVADLTCILNIQCPLKINESMHCFDIWV
jgi:hypothetical protein